VPNAELQAWVTLSKDILTGLAALTAAVIGIAGFQTWKKQLHWKTQYELAQRMLRATYKVRNAIVTLRFQIMFIAATHGGPHRRNEESNQVVDPSWTEIASSTYQKYWQKVEDALLELDGVSLEVEAIWGEMMKEEIRELRNYGTTMNNAWEMNPWFLQNPAYKPSRAKTPNYPMFQTTFLGPSKDNPFLGNLHQAVRQIEEFLRPYLKM
jgi:hypothetical protein